MVGDGARLGEARDQSASGARVDEPLGRKWRDISVRGVHRIAKDLFEMKICGERAVGRVDVGWRERTDEHPFADGLKQPRERVRTGLSSNGTRRFRDGTNGKPRRKRRQESEP